MLETTTPTTTPELTTRFNAYSAGYRFAILGERGRVIHRITETGKTACNGTEVQPTDRLFTTFSAAQAALGITVTGFSRWPTMEGLCHRETYS